MTEKKDPNQENMKTGPSENDLIIELTDEVETKSDGNAFVGLDDQLIDDKGEFGEDEFIISPIEDPSEIEDDDRLMLIEEFHLDSEENSDVSISDEMDSNLGEDTMATKRDVDEFEFDEEIELEIENDEDEYDFVAIDDEHPEDDIDRPGLLDDLELKFDEEDDIISLDKDQEEKSDTVALKDEESQEIEVDGELPDLITEIEFAFEEDNDSHGIIATDDQKAEDSDGIIKKAFEKSPASKEVKDRIELTSEHEIEPQDDSEIISLDDTQIEDDEITASVQEEVPDFEHNNGLLNLDADIRLEPENEMIPRDESGDIDILEDEDIIEITEFDEHFPEEHEEILGHESFSNVSDTEKKDIVNLIGIEDEELIETDNSEEEIRLENDIAEPSEEPPAMSPDLAMTAGALSSGIEELDFKLDSGKIPQPVDELNANPFEDSTLDPEEETFPEDPFQEDEPTQEDLQTISEISESSAVSPELIATTVERVINEKLSGKIDDIIYQVIEKAVSKEINRLKEVLFNDSTPSGSQ